MLLLIREPPTWTSSNLKSLIVFLATADGPS